MVPDYEGYGLAACMSLPGIARVKEYLQCESHLLVDSLGNQVRELQKEVNRLCEHEAFINMMHKEISSIMEEGQPEKALEDTPSLEGRKWQLFTSGNRQHSFPGSVAVQLENGYEDFALDEKKPHLVVGEARSCTSKHECCVPPEAVGAW